MILDTDGTLLGLFERLPFFWRDLLFDLEGQFEVVERSITRIHDWKMRLVPSPELIFAALNRPPEEVKVLLVGQDPYPNQSHAIGRSFAVPENVVPLPGSLRNIIIEKMADVGGGAPPPTLESWESQGVMLLNTTLTTWHGESGAHLSIGWQVITRRIIEITASQGAVGLLWGKSAHRFESIFSGRAVTGVHPSPLSAYRGFFGSKPFSKINDLLGEPIEW